MASKLKNDENYKYAGIVAKGVSANEVKKIVNSIKKKNGGIFKMDFLVKEAENPSHPLHNYFQWDDSIAGHQYRLIQARNLIASIIIDNKGHKKAKVKAFVNVMLDENNNFTFNKFEPNKESIWVESEKLLEDEKLYQYRLKRALQELTWFQEKYAGINELEPVMIAIDSVNKNNQD